MGKPTTTKKTTTVRRAKLPAAAEAVTTNETEPTAKPKRAAKAAPRANGAKPAAKKPAARKPKAKAAPKASGFTNDDIALRAYFIGEHRRRSGIDGSPEGDWLEAERQLRASVAA